MDVVGLHLVTIRKVRMKKRTQMKVLTAHHNSRYSRSLEGSASSQLALQTLYTVMGT